jgi:hypothetical protein
LPELTLDARINRLLSAGGFPEAYLNPKEAARLRNDRMYPKGSPDLFFDCAAAYDETGGAQLENLVASSLLKYSQGNKPRRAASDNGLDAA